jgi:opacity protein-like surface antigen
VGRLELVEVGMTKAAHLVRTMAALAAMFPALTLAQAGSTTAPPPGYAAAAPPPHRLELVGVVGYHIASDLDYVSGFASIDSAMSYGAALRTGVAPGSKAELSWTYVPTNAHFRSTAFGTQTADSSLNIHYFQIGGQNSFRRDRLEPYFGGSLGAALFQLGSLRNPINNVTLQSSDIWRFAFTFGLGTKIWLAPNVAIQLDARMLLPVWFSSASIYAGTGGGGFAVSGGIPIIEGNFTGGLVIAL